LEKVFDASRANNKNYGLNFGAKFDEYIENKIDTGDLIFYYRNPPRYSLIYLKSLLKPSSIKANNFNHLAMALRTNNTLMLVEINHGIVSFMKYDELLRDSSIEAIKLRLKTEQKRIQKTECKNF